ncbi:MAG: hypothetical protein ACP5NP_05095 [Acetobacteraceae bacterium]
MPESVLLRGASVEDAEAARTQVWTFDRATVYQELRRVTVDRNRPPPTDAIRHAQDSGFVLPMTRDDWRAAKLNRILYHLELRFSDVPTAEELRELCLKAEQRAVALLSRLEGGKRKAAGEERFSGSTVMDLTRYVVLRVFRQVDATFARMPPQEKERAASEMARLLAEMPEDVRQRIRAESRLANLSADALSQTGAIAAVGVALVGGVGLAGFAAYTSLTSFIAAAAGLVGVTLPFGFYMVATSALAMFTNPFLVFGVALAGGRFLTSRATHQMRDRLIPMMVATSALAGASADSPSGEIKGLVRQLTAAWDRRSTEDAIGRIRIDRTFPALPKPR